MIDAKRAQSENESAPERLAAWYLRTTADRDTHRGWLFADGCVMADCGVTFRPLKAVRDRGPALPGYPPDPGQTPCSAPDCVRVAARLSADGDRECSGVGR